MNDPYRILGVSEDTDDDGIKKAYRELVKKYHPDRYQNSPLASEANEKMKEINQAYDKILKERQTKTQYMNQNIKNDNYVKSDKKNKYENTYYSENIVYENVRDMIKKFNFTDAEAILSKIYPTERTSEWYYLMSIISYNRGWLEEANNYIETAYSMDSSNAEYYQMYKSIKEQRAGKAESTNRTGCCCTLCGDSINDVCDCIF